MRPCVAYAPAMPTRIRRSLALVSTLSLLLLAFASVSPVAAQDADDCVLKVQPRSGAPGTEFVFTGSGYTPARIVLKREGAPSKTVQVTAGDEDSFTIRLIAGPNDGGTWKATAIEPDGCRAVVSFTVGLPPTSTMDAADDGTRSAALAGFAALGALFILSSVVVLPRVTRSARSR